MNTQAGPKTKITVPAVRILFEAEDRKRILKDLDDCLTSGMVAADKHVKAFEEEWAAYCGSKVGVACANGGAALDLILRSLDIRDKDVLVPTNTFIATVQSVIAAGGNPVFLDTDPQTMGVSLQEIEGKCTDRTAGVIVVHVGGIVSHELPRIAEWAKSRQIWLVEDAAHAHGSDFGGLRPGRFGIAAAYSFFATKVITSGEGGMVVTDDEGIAEECRRLRDYGKKSQWESVHTRLSGNYRMSDLTAIVARHQVRRLDEYIEQRQMAAEIYTAGLRSVLQLVIPKGRTSWYKYIAYLPEDVDRPAFKQRLKEKNISLSGGVYDLPVHLQPVFADLMLSGKLPLAETVCRTHICLPIFPGITREQAEYVVNTAISVLRDFNK